MAITLMSSVRDLHQVGETRARKLEKLGIFTVRDLLTYYPRRYEDRRAFSTIQQAPPGEKICIRASVTKVPQCSTTGRGKNMVSVTVEDESGTMRLTFFNQRWVKDKLECGQEYVFYGAVEPKWGGTMTNPIFEEAGKSEETGRIIPVYHLTAGITNRMMSSLVREVLYLAAYLPETLPPFVREKYDLAGVKEAVRAIHFPEDDEKRKRAQYRLIFDELFYLFMGLCLMKNLRDRESRGCQIPEVPWGEFHGLLNFEPTEAQRRVMAEIAADLASGRPMNRMVQGDVGSGKTIVAAYAAWLTIRAGHQVALMAPTEILAAQHAQVLTDLFAPAGIRVSLLTGSLTAAEKRRCRRALEEGETDLAVGTHALISGDVRFRDLALIVTDEQHRFGVAQRAALAAKGGESTIPHGLVMSATPIPRTLALIVYGDLDISLVDQLPPGRAPVNTYVLRSELREQMYRCVRRQVAEGHQVYIVCPAVEEREGDQEEEGTGMDLQAVKTYEKKLSSEVFPDLTVGLMHGKMKPKEKDAAMKAFISGETQVLVSTTVVEVGVDVPNATVMVVENADRFGLSQLHQLRGRVGRGSFPSQCILIAAATAGPDALERLQTLANTRDGFQIAEADLRLRGPGEFFGSRQHGMPRMKLASLTGDIRVLEQAQAAARKLLERDPTLGRPENRLVLKQIQQLFGDMSEILS